MQLCEQGITLRIASFDSDSLLLHLEKDWLSFFDLLIACYELCLHRVANWFGEEFCMVLFSKLNLHSMLFTIVEDNFIYIPFCRCVLVHLVCGIDATMTCKPKFPATPIWILSTIICLRIPWWTVHITLTLNLRKCFIKWKTVWTLWTSLSNVYWTWTMLGDDSL